MIGIVPSWKVRITFTDGVERSFNIYDNHYGNFLRKLAEIEFLEDIQTIVIFPKGK